MKILKKVVACASSVLIMTSSICFSAQASEIELNALNATSYTTADVNRNGVVDLTDCVLVNQCLTGLRYVSDLRLVDADANGIVDSADSICILSEAIGDTSYYTGVQGSPYVFRSVSTLNLYNPPSSASVSEKYVKHTYSTNKDTTYTLSMQETAFPTSVSSSNEVIGDDGRYAESDADMKSGICRLNDGATGFVVGDHVIATAAHCVYTMEKATWDEKLYVQFPDGNVKNGYVNTDTAKKYYAVETHIEKSYYDARSYTTEMSSRDYALITVSEDLSDRYHFSLGIPYDAYPLDYPVENYNIYVTGFPQDLGDTKYLYTGYGKLHNGNTNMLTYDTDTKGGNSGSPVYIKAAYFDSGEPDGHLFYTVVGIHVSGGTYNHGSVMTPLRLKFYKNNSEIKY